MEYIFQISIIAGVSFFGELLNRLLPLPVPGSIYGLVIMLVCLMTGIIKLEQVKKVGTFLITLMPIMFVGPVVGLMTSVETFKKIIVPVFVICIVTTVVTMAVTGRVSQLLIKLKSKKHGEG